MQWPRYFWIFQPPIRPRMRRSRRHKSRTFHSAHRLLLSATMKPRGATSPRDVSDIRNKVLFLRERPNRITPNHRLESVYCIIGYYTAHHRLCNIHGYILFWSISYRVTLASAVQWSRENAKGSHDSLHPACLKQVVLRDKSNSLSLSLFFSYTHTYIYKMCRVLLIDPADITCPLWSAVPF